MVYFCFIVCILLGVFYFDLLSEFKTLKKNYDLSKKYFDNQISMLKQNQTCILDNLVVFDNCLDKLSGQKGFKKVCIKEKK